MVAQAGLKLAAVLWSAGVLGFISMSYHTGLGSPCVWPLVRASAKTKGVHRVGTEEREQGEDRFALFITTHSPGNSFEAQSLLPH